EKACRSRSGGEGTSGRSAAGSGSGWGWGWGSGACGAAASARAAGVWGAAGEDCVSPPSSAGAGLSGSGPSSAVLRNSAARGPSRMLARLFVAMFEDLLGELPIGVGGRPVRVVFEDRHTLHRRLGEADRLADT